MPYSMLCCLFTFKRLKYDKTYFTIQYACFDFILIQIIFCRRLYKNIVTFAYTLHGQHLNHTVWKHNSNGTQRNAWLL